MTITIEYKEKMTRPSPTVADRKETNYISGVIAKNYLQLEEVTYIDMIKLLSEGNKFKEVYNNVRVGDELTIKIKIV